MVEALVAATSVAFTGEAAVHHRGRHQSDGARLPVLPDEKIRFHRGLCTGGNVDAVASGSAVTGMPSRTISPLSTPVTRRPTESARSQPLRSAGRGFGTPGRPACDMRLPRSPTALFTRTAAPPSPAAAPAAWGSGWRRRNCGVAGEAGDTTRPQRGPTMSRYRPRAAALPQPAPSEARVANERVDRPSPGPPAQRTPRSAAAPPPVTPLLAPLSRAI